MMSCFLVEKLLIEWIEFLPRLVESGHDVSHATSPRSTTNRLVAHRHKMLQVLRICTARSLHDSLRTMEALRMLRSENISGAYAMP